MKDKEKLTVIVVHYCPILEDQDHDECGYPQLFGKLCYYSRYYLRLQCRADLGIIDRIVDEQRTSLRPKKLQSP